MSDEQSFELSLEQVADFEFCVRFDGTAIPVLSTDEPPPQGHNAGPNPARLLLATVANCLTASLLFSLRKFRNEPGPIKTNTTSGQRAAAHVDNTAAMRFMAAQPQHHRFSTPLPEAHGWHPRTAVLIQVNMLTGTTGMLARPLRAGG